MLMGNKKIYIPTHTFSFCFTHIGICLLWKGLLGCLSKRYHLSLSLGGLPWLPRKEKKLTASIQRKYQNTQKSKKRTLFNSIKQNNGQHKLNHLDNEQNGHGTQKQQNSRRKIRYLKFLPPSHCLHCSSVPFHRIKALILKIWTSLCFVLSVLQLFIYNILQCW